MRVEALLPIAGFLGRAWAGRRDLNVVISYDDNRAYTTADKITVPSPSKLPAKDLVGSYRIWRTLLWHEAMHHNQGSFKSPLSQYMRKYVTDEKATILIEIALYIEDYRIEERGIREYPGMKKELNFTRSIYYNLSRPPCNIREAFAQLLLLGATKFEAEDKLIEAVNYVKKAVAQGEDNSLTMALEVCRILNIDPNTELFTEPVVLIGFTTSEKLNKEKMGEAIKQWIESKRDVLEKIKEKERSSKEEEKNKEEEMDEDSSPNKEGGEGGESCGEEVKKDIPRSQKELDLDEYDIEEEDLEEMEEEVLSGEDILNPSQNDLEKIVEKLMEAPKEVVEELKEARKISEELDFGRRGTKSEIDTRIITPSKLDVSEEPYYDKDLIIELKSQLRKVVRKYREVPAAQGELDVDSYISRSRRIFTDEEKIDVGGFKVLILLDHSLSIRKYEEEYKKATIALCEALDFIKVPFAVFAFSAPPKYPTKIYLIKSFEEKWSRMKARRLAQIEAEGGTPLDDVYEVLSKVVVKNPKDLIFLTFTDGEPGSYYATKVKIQELKNHCKMVAVAIGKDMEEVLGLVRNLKELKYEKYIAVDNIKKIPEKILRLLGEYGG